MKILACALLVSSLVACSKAVPASTKPVVDAVRPAAESIATTAAALCAAQYTSGRFVVSGKGCEIKLLPGEKLVPELPSPAKGSPLETNPNVVDVLVTCMAPTSAPGASPTTSCGQGLGSLRKPAAQLVYNNPVDHAESTCKGHESDCSEVTFPSRYSTAPDAVDLHLVRPVAGGPAGATAEVVVVIAKK